MPNGKEPPMKKYFALVLMMILSLTLLCGSISIAEETDVPGEAFSETENDTEQDIESDSDADELTLEDAFAAYRKAKAEKRLAEYKAELNEMVGNGWLTREEADLLLEYAAERNAQIDADCANCEKGMRGRGACGMKGESCGRDRQKRGRK